MPIRIAGDFGVVGGTNINNAPAAVSRGFNPRTGAAGLTFRGFNFDLRLSAIYRGKYIYTPTTNAAQVEYSKDRLMLNWKSRYNFSERFALFFDVENLTGQPLNHFYRVFEERVSNHGEFIQRYQGGITGRF